MVFVLLVLAVLTVTEYRPADVEAVETYGEAQKQLQIGDTIDVISWNIGFGALGDNADFFMDGGEMVKPSSKERVVINLHLEAYDDGVGKEAQTQMLSELFEKEVAKGNYVIAGGDFNQTLDTVDLTSYPQQNEELWKPGLIDTAAFADVQCLMDACVPSCRSLDRVYDSGDPQFQYYVIDGFLVSGNLTVQKLETVDLGFTASDHNPVRLQVIVEK